MCAFSVKSAVILTLSLLPALVVADETASKPASGRAATAPGGPALSTSQAADWPQWRGPTRNGVSVERDLLNAWPAEGLKQIWKVVLGGCHSSPVVADGKVYCVAQEGDKAILACLDKKDGKKLWSVPFGEQGKSPAFGNQGPYATPTVDGDRVYVMTSAGTVACVSAADRKVLWSHIREKLDLKTAGWGASSSFLIVGDLAIINNIAFKKTTGEVAWKGDQAVIDHSSPVLVKVDGKEQIILEARNGVLSVDPATGKENWFCKGADEVKSPGWNVILTPVWTGQELLAIARTKKYGSPVVALTVGKAAGDSGYKLDLAISGFPEPTNACQCSSPVSAGKWVFGVITDNPKSTMLCCSLEDGKVAWKKDVPDNTWSSPLLADGRVYQQLADGTLLMFKADGAEYRELGRAKICDQTRASPALSDGHLFIRDDESVICLKVD
jgi:outer membrane protein assembly factor BamB